MALHGRGWVDRSPKCALQLQLCSARWTLGVGSEPTPPAVGTVGRHRRVEVACTRTLRKMLERGEFNWRSQERATQPRGDLA